MMKKIIFFLLCVCIGLSTISCSDNSNNEKYASVPPVFVDVILKNIEHPNEPIKAGDSIEAKLLQNRRGKLFYNAQYRWYFTPLNNSDKHQYRPGCVYDNDPFIPIDTFIVQNKGNYILHFYAKYKASGNRIILPAIKSYSNKVINFSIEYSISQQICIIRISKSIYVN